MDFGAIFILIAFLLPLFLLWTTVLGAITGMDFGFAAAFMMFWLPWLIIWNFWKNLEGRIWKPEALAIMIGWILGLFSSSVHRDEFMFIAIVNIAQIVFLIMFILFTMNSCRRRIIKNYAIAFVLLSCVYVLANLGFTFRDREEFSRFAYRAGATIIGLMVVVCNIKGPIFHTVVATLGNGLIWSIIASPDESKFTVIPNVIGFFFGLVMLLVCARRRFIRMQHTKPQHTKPQRTKHHILRRGRHYKK